MKANRLAAAAVATGFVALALTACGPGGTNGAAGTPTAGAPVSTGGSTHPTTTESATLRPLPSHTATATRATPTATPGASRPAEVPVLGASWAPGQKGYGQAQPVTVFNGGDPTGLVEQLAWSSWGGPSATGTGTAEYVGPGQSVATGIPAQADIVAFDLGTCHGRTAYRAIEWYFPAHGQHFDATRYLDACTGENHGM
ncbi:hypothetical protein [Kitasatospora sp. NPDC097691]|uniref:hypothetical protein n=1 Tax=Kitasatospora sp. NPDC097691 TaxID=3157231 RepID=UPI00332622CB